MVLEARTVRSAQPLRQLSNCAVDKRRAALLVEIGNDDVAGRSDGDIDRGSADFVKCLRLGLGNALLSQLAPSFQCLFQRSAKRRRLSPTPRTKPNASPRIRREHWNRHWNDGDN